MRKKRTAKGIPDRDKITELPSRGQKGALWRLVIQEHLADRAGRHFDIRLVPLDKKQKQIAYSWATRQLPSPNQKTLAIRQPDHEVEYLDFSGVISQGYGKGLVRKYLDNVVKVLESSPGKITFVDITPKDPEVYTLLRPKKKDAKTWLIINHTPTTENRAEIPLWKPSYKEDKPENIHRYLDKQYVIQPKIDGAHVLIYLRKDKTPEIYSYRKSQRSNRLLNHTYKIPEIEKYKVPKELHNTIIRAELTFEDNNNNVVKAREVAPLLNASTLNSLIAQKLKRYKPKIYLFDVHQYKNKDYQRKPYKDKLKILHQIAKVYKKLNFVVPATVEDKQQKMELLQRIAQGKHSETKEGIVVRHLKDEKQIPIKIKIRPEYDVYIRDIFPIRQGRHKGELAGGFYYSFTPNGHIVGKVGTGFDRELRRDMWRNKDRYIGMIARVTALEKYPNGALRTPAFVDFHIDKNLIKNAFLVGFLERIF